tara:strand:- start:74 stop:307 length:234 start_codon:yes stop_codon:yes gene_type:complete
MIELWKYKTMSGEHLTSKNLEREANASVNVREISRRVNINHLLSKVREEKNKERNENYLFLGVVLSVIAITGVLASL